MGSHSFFLVSTPVSYTHLDVYKRQVFLLGQLLILGFQGVEIGQLLEALIFQCLGRRFVENQRDVYKRQLMNLVCSKLLCAIAAPHEYETVTAVVSCACLLYTSRCV